jgi:Protein of unknown function (DUF1688)
MGASDCVRSLLTARAVRERAHEMLALCEAAELANWSVDLDALSGVADYVLATTRDDYPDLIIPFHSRWRHFKIGEVDLGASYQPAPHESFVPIERARAAFDLAVVSVLLDAGAGAEWSYRPRSGAVLGRSEGLAVASVEMFESGLFSSRPAEPRRVDAVALADLTLEALARGFQADEANRLAGLDGRLALLRGLGRQMAARPDLFEGEDGFRPSGLLEGFAELARRGAMSAAALLETLLNAFGPIWPSRRVLAGVPLGDVWAHPAIRRGDLTNGLVPFHKLTQWLAYSLIEPLQWAGMAVRDVDALTGLAEYRNGGLFVDLGVLKPRSRSILERKLAPEESAVVEWRALTVALLDLLASRMRRALGRSSEGLPLARVLQGGSWEAGRRIARRLRPDGSPPLAIMSDGTVF